jgi:type II secretory pathway pseudopilin PulG
MRNHYLAHKEQSFNQNINKGGVTLVELMVVFLILFILIGIISNSFTGFRNSKVLDTTEEQVLALLSEARSDTLSAKGDDQYGVHFATDQMALYRGATYSTLDVNNKVTLLDGVIEISTITLAGGGTDVLFNRLTGSTAQSGTLVIRVKSDTSRNRTISIAGTGVTSGQ